MGNGPLLVSFVYMKNYDWNNKKDIIPLIILLLSSCISYSQRDTTFSHRTSSNIKLAYNSSLIYPGLRMGTETPFHRRIITKTKKSGKQKLVYKDQFFSSNFGWYRHPGFHDNLYLTVGYTIRRTGGKGFFAEFSPELGYSRTFLGGTTYRVDDNGNVSIKRMAGYNYGIVSLGGGIGYDLSITHAKPFAVYFKFNVLTMFPYNSTVYVRPAMELGVIYKPKYFLGFNTKIKHKHR